MKEKVEIPPDDLERSRRADAQYAEDVLSVGGRSHEVWREGWRVDHTREDGSVEPRPKSTTDDEWIAAHNGVAEVDIAHTDFQDLPKDRQAESMASAIVAVEDVYRDAFYNDYIEIYENEGEAAVREFATSDKIHKGWLERNGSWASEEQKLPFAQLSQAEKDKDIDFHIGAVEAVINRIKDRSLETPDELLLKWLNEDVESLAQIDGYNVKISDIEPIPGGWVHIKTSGKYMNLDGEYPLETIAKVLNDELKTAKEDLAERQERNEQLSAVIGNVAAGYLQLPN